MDTTLKTQLASKGLTWKGEEPTMKELVDACELKISKQEMWQRLSTEPQVISIGLYPEKALANFFLTLE